MTLSGCLETCRAWITSPLSSRSEIVSWRACWSIPRYIIVLLLWTEEKQNSLASLGNSYDFQLPSFIDIKGGDLLVLLKHRATEGTVTFVYADHDDEHNSAVVLKDYLGGL